MSKIDMSLPKVAWPTVILFFGSIILWVASLLLSLSGRIPIALGLVLSTIAAFVSFTPMHDSAHRTVSRLYWINELIGRINTILLMFPFPGLRYLHLEHHRHTNDDQKDPDYWSGRRPVWMLPIRWFTQDLHYFVFYSKRLNQRPLAERLECLLTILLLWTVIVWFCVMGQTEAVFLLWVLPSRIAGLALAYSFDYLPHKPHEITAAHNAYKATLVRPSWLLTPILLYQNYHLIHHLYPGVPFYRYARIWHDQRELLLTKGVETRDLLGRIRKAS